MESSNNEGLRSVNWPSLEEYGNLKTRFKVENKQAAMDLLNNCAETEDWSKKQKKIGSDLILNFMWGVECVSEAFGYTGERPLLKLDYSQNVASSGRISPNNTEHTIGTNILLETIVNIISNKDYKVAVYPDPYNPPIARYRIFPADLYEITGVEEMAHSIYILAKNSNGKSFVASDNGYYDYLAQDHEYRALYWKAAYAKRYMPDVYEDLHTLTGNIRYSRSPESREAEERKNDPFYNNGNEDENE